MAWSLNKFYFLGIIHGFFLIVNHGYRKIVGNLPILKINSIFSWFLTFFCINLSLGFHLELLILTKQLLFGRACFQLIILILPRSLSKNLGLKLKNL